MNGHSIRWHGEDLELLPARALFWPRERLLLLADVHLGKDQVFRRHGIAIPAGPTGADLATLDDLLHRFAPSRLVILGDLVHAPPARADAWPAELATWRAAHAGVAMELVLGNHDRSLLPWLARWQIDACHERSVGPFTLRHEPVGGTDAPVIAGHIHPVLKLRDGRRESIRLPVFWFGERQAVLPAFGGFTGGHVIDPAPGDALYGVAGDSVVPVRAPLAAAAGR